MDYFYKQQLRKLHEEYAAPLYHRSCETIVFQRVSFRVIDSAEICSPKEIKEKLDYLNDKFDFEESLADEKKEISFDGKIYSSQKMWKFTLTQFLHILFTKGNIFEFQSKHRELKRFKQKQKKVAATKKTTPIRGSQSHHGRGNTLNMAPAGPSYQEVCYIY